MDNKLLLNQGLAAPPHAKSNASRLQLPCYHNVFIAGFPPVLFILSSLCIQHKNTFAALEVWGESRGKYRKQRGRVYRFFFCCSLRGSEESEPGSGPKRQVEGYLFKGKGSWAWATQKHALPTPFSLFCSDIGTRQSVAHQR